MKKFPHCTCLFLFTNGMYEKAAAQLSLSAQVRTRTELREGQGSPLPKGAPPAFFTSQRTRLNADFQMNAFDPLYGTPHKFWGLMDYFYVASPFGGNGLKDFYLKTRYKISDKFLVNADFHQFNTAVSRKMIIRKALDRRSTW